MIKDIFLSLFTHQLWRTAEKYFEKRTKTKTAEKEMFERNHN